MKIHRDNPLTGPLSSQPHSSSGPIMGGSPTKGGKGICFGCIFIIFAFIFCIFMWTSVFVEHTWFLPGDTSRFDPVASYEAVHNHAGANTELVSIEASFVRPDGTMDLNASYTPGPSVLYTFQRPLQEPPKNAPPLGAGSSVNNKWYEKITVKAYRPWAFAGVRKISAGSSSQYQYFNLGMEKDTFPPSSFDRMSVPAPTCSFQKFWEVALTKGAPKNAVAVITYDHNGYEFSINRTSNILHFGQNCQLKEGTGGASSYDIEENFSVDIDNSGSGVKITIPKTLNI